MALAEAKKDHMLEVSEMQNEISILQMEICCAQRKMDIFSCIMYTSASSVAENCFVDPNTKTLCDWKPKTFFPCVEIIDEANMEIFLCFLALFES